MIGETLDDGNNITGARIIDKSTPFKKLIYRIEIWFCDWKNEEFKESLKERLLKIMEECDISPRELIFNENDCSKWQK